MGRIAGVTAAEIRERLLRAAADVFAERGYDGTRVADIASAAFVSNAALYAHYASKAELLVEALRAHGPRMLADVVRADPDQPVADVLLTVGDRLPRRRDASASLIVEALVAARRDKDVARLLSAHLAERADLLADLVRAGQLAGEFDRAMSPDAVAHFCLLLAMGSALVPTDLHGVDPRPWRQLLRRLVAALGDPDKRARRERVRREREGGDGGVRVRIDSERCQGHGRCYDLAPEIFGEDDEGYGQVLDGGTVPANLEALAKRAVMNCPEGAIALMDEEA